MRERSIFRMAYEKLKSRLWVLFCRQESAGSGASCSAVLEFKTIPKNTGASWWRMEEAAVQTASSQTPRPPPPPFARRHCARRVCVFRVNCCAEPRDVFIARGACSRCTQHSQYAPQYAAFHISAFDQLRQIKQDYCPTRVHSPLSKTNIIVTQFATMFRAPNDYMLQNMAFMQIQVNIL